MDLYSNCAAKAYGNEHSSTVCENSGVTHCCSAMYFAKKYAGTSNKAPMAAIQR